MSWYAIRTTNRQEGFVQRALTEARLFAYVPKHIDEAKFARRVATRTRPLIPGYVFAELPDDDAVQVALAIQGVNRHARRIPLRDIDVGALVLEEACHAYDETWKPPRPKGRRYSRRFKAGEIAKVVSGHFDGREVLILRTKNKDRLDVLLRIFGRDIEVELEERQLAATQDVALSRAA